MSEQYANSNFSDEIIAEAPPSELASTIRDVRGPEGFQVILTMPKFKIEYNLADLPKRLADLGVSKMFIAGECDFGNLFSDVSLEFSVPVGNAFFE